MLVKYYRSYSTFRHIFNTLVVSLLISVLLLASILSAVFSSVLTRQTNDISTRMLSRLTFMISQIYNDAYSIMLSLGYGENIDINNMMFGETQDRLRDYSGHKRMRLLQSIYPGISYMGVYNGVLDELTCTVGLEVGTRSSIREAILNSFEQRNTRLIVPINNRSIVQKGFDPESKTLTLIYYSPLSGKDRIGAIFVAIDCKYLGQFIRTVNENDDQTSFLIDSQGVVLSHPDKSQIFTNYNEVAYAKNALLSPQKSGFYFSNVGNKKNLVTYLKDTDLGWTYFTLTPYDKLTATIRAVNGAIIVISLIILLLGAMFSLRAARRTFNPIASLLSKTGYPCDDGKSRRDTDIGYLDSKIANYVQTIHSEEVMLLGHAYESLLNGNLNKENADLLLKQEANWASPFYMICLMSISKSQHYRDLAKTEKHYLRYTLASIAEECLRPLTSGITPVFMSSASIALIVRLPDYYVPNGLILALIETQKKFMEHSEMRYSTSISDIYPDLFVLQDAYEEAVQRMTQRFFSAEEGIFQSDPPTATMAAYNSKLEHEIWSAISMGDDKLVETAVRQFVGELRTLSCKFAKHYIRQLAMNIIAFSLVQAQRKEMDAYVQFMHEIEYGENLDDCLAGIIQLCRQISSFNHHEDSNGRELLERAKQLAAEHYMDPAFSTNTAAQESGLSVTYFNRVFRLKTGTSYSTYLNSFRLNVAQSLLCSSSLSMSRICQNVGLSNESYFYSLFKNEYGVTPHQYRSIHKSQRKDSAVVL